MSFRFFACFFVAAVPLFFPGIARAAESYAGCSGFVDALPIVIDTSGIWCLRQDLATPGHAIIIEADDVTIDCNGHKLDGGLDGLWAGGYGVQALDRKNIVVRRCKIQGFLYGIKLAGSQGKGHVVEDSHFDGNSYIGVYVSGDGSVVRRNMVTNTGGSLNSPSSGMAYGIYVFDSVNVVDNIISGVRPTAGGSAYGEPTGSTWGIYTWENSKGTIGNNRVRGLTQIGAGGTYAIYNVFPERISVRGNSLIGNGTAGSIGVGCDNGYEASNDPVLGNIISGFDAGITFCFDAGGNDVTP